MPSPSSHLRQASPLAGSPVTAVHAHPLSPRPAKKQKMSITQTYYLAHAARGKLSHEAARADHDLRLLVGHANLLDSLMLELHDAEREQEAWFNNAVKHSSHHNAVQESKKIRWADAIDEAEDEADSDDSDADDYPSDEEEEYAPKTPLSAALSRSKSPAPGYSSDEEEEEDEDMDMEELQLSRTTSHSASPPELISDDSSDEELDEAVSPTNEPASLQLEGVKARDFGAAAAAASSSPSKVVPRQPVVVDNGALHQPNLVAAF